MASLITSKFLSASRKNSVKIKTQDGRELEISDIGKLKREEIDYIIKNLSEIADKKPPS